MATTVRAVVMGIVSQLKASLGDAESICYLRSYLASPNDRSRRRVVTRLFGIGHRLDCAAGRRDDDAGTNASGHHAGEYGREEVLLGVLEGAVEFATERGFTAGAAHQFLQLFLDTLELLGSESTLACSVTQLKRMAQSYSLCLPPSFLLPSVQYITDSLLQHHRLYGYLLTEEQPTDASLVQLSVAPPTPAPPALEAAVSLAEWQRAEQIKELESAQAQQRLECARTREKVLQDAQRRLQEVFDAQLSKLDGSHSCGEAEIKEMIASLTRAQVEHTRTALLQELARNKLDIGFHLEKLEI